MARDITEHKKMEQALIESESRYRSLVESGGAGIATVNMAGQISFANDALCRMTGYSKEEVLMKQFADFVHPGDMDNTIRLFAEAVEGKTLTDYVQFRLVCKDGREVWFYTNPTAMVVNGEVIGFSTILQDITARMNAEEALRLSEEKFRDLTELLPQVVFEADTQGVFTYVNRRGYEVFGYTPDEVIGKLNVADVITPEERDRAMKSYFAILGGGTTAGNEYTVVRKDGSTFNVITFTNTIVQNGEAIGLRGIFTDISRIKKTENALRESEEKYRSVYEHAGEAMYIAQDGIVKFANPRTFEIVHYTAEELSSRPFIEMVHPEDRDMVAQRYLNRLKGEEEIPMYPLRIIDKEGTVKWLELRATLIEWEGRPATLNFVTDITIRKQAEQALKESEERYRLLAENSLDVIWTADMQGELTYVSPSIRYLVGRSADEITNMYAQRTLTPGVFGVAEEDGKRFWNGPTDSPCRSIPHAVLRIWA